MRDTKEELIRQEIDKLNDEQERTVKYKITACIYGIRQQQQSIAEATLKLSSYRKELAELTIPPEITKADIL